jgi:hypothetical protein
MKRLPGLAVFVCVLLVALAGDAASQVDPAMSDIPECLSMSVGPRFPGNPIGVYAVVIRDVGGLPVGGAFVRIAFNAASDKMIAWCPGQAHPVIGPLVTDPTGRAAFEIYGGGCITDPVAQGCGYPAATLDVFNPADGSTFAVPIRCVNSPDVMNALGFQAGCPPSNTCDGPAPGTSIAGLVDAVFHGKAIKNALPELCTQFAPPYGGPVALLDAVYVSQYLKAGSVCACQ